MSDDLPKAVWSGSFRLFGVEVKCHTLDNGQRLIEPESFAALMREYNDPTRNTTNEEELDELARFARWQKGVDK